MATQASRLAAVGNRRVVLIVAIAALAAAGAVVGATLWQTHGESTALPVQPGKPVLQLEFGLRTDSEARALAHAENLFNKNHDATQAEAIFSRYHSLDAQLGVLFTTWSGPSSLPAVQRLVAAHPDDPAGLLNLGWAEYWAGRPAGAAGAWEKTARTFPDSPYAVDAEDALHPKSIPGLPVIVTGLELPAALKNLPAEQQLAELRRAAVKPNVRAKLLYGAALWTYLRRPLSAERQFAAAAKLAPHDPLARTLAAVGLFSKADPTRAFAKLGPLTAVFPHSAIVQFHLAVLLLYIGEDKKAAEHFRDTIADAPHSPYATYAKTLLASVARTRSK
jgi:tetratricopeptide (TPR) repeat protein